MEDLTGRQFGPYQIVSPLGEGGMAAVYKAYQPVMERHVAIKILPRHFVEDPQFIARFEREVEDPQFIARFEREVKVMAQLQHPHILAVFDYGLSEGYAYIVMPLIRCGTLANLLQGKPRPLFLIRQVISQVGDALNYAHVHGLIHRDVKPSNVLVDEGGKCLLTDFGLARMVDVPQNLTTTGAIMGTPAYMSPEQGSGQPVDARSDIYSLGVILYEMATGRVPYKAETPVAIIIKHLRDPLPPARELNPHLPEAVELVILKALAKSPEDRYQTAGEMVAALQSACSSPPVSSSTRLGQEFEKTVVSSSHTTSRPRNVARFWVKAVAVAAALFVACAVLAFLGVSAKSVKSVLAAVPSFIAKRSSEPSQRSSTSSEANVTGRRNGASSGSETIKADKEQAAVENVSSGVVPDQPLTAVEDQPASGTQRMLGQTFPSPAVAAAVAANSIGPGTSSADR